MSEEETSKANGSEAARSSTSYPAYDLEEALRFGRAVQEAGGNEALETEVMQALNLKSRSSRAWSYRLSSAREFGLAERSGRGDDAKIRVTDLFKRVTMPGSEAEKRAATMQALLKPPLYTKLIEKYSGAPVPEAQMVANVLAREFGLIESVKMDAATAFLSSVRFAGAINPHNTISVDLGDPGPSIHDRAPADPGSDATLSEHAVPVPADFIRHVFQLRRDLQIVVPLPPDLTPRDVERMHRWMQTLPVDDEELG